MFRGTSFNNLDAKGRLIVPARFRDVLRQSSVNGFMVSQMDGALCCYNIEEWRNVPLNPPFLVLLQLYSFVK